MGTTSGEPREGERFDDYYAADTLDQFRPEFIRRYPCNLIAANVAREFGFEGLSLVLPTACAAGNHAIAHACDALRSGRADLMLAGGSDSFSRITYAGFARLGAVAPETCQPFDRDRKGMIPGEGAAVLVLETLDGRGFGYRGRDLCSGRLLRSRSTDDQSFRTGSGLRSGLRSESSPRASGGSRDEQRLRIRWQ